MLSDDRFMLVAIQVISVWFQLLGLDLGSQISTLVCEYLACHRQRDLRPAKADKVSLNSGFRKYLVGVQWPQVKLLNCSTASACRDKTSLQTDPHSICPESMLAPG